MTVWPHLDSQASKVVQLAMASVILLSNSCHVLGLYFGHYSNLQQGNSFSLHQNLGMADTFPTFCIFLLLTGHLSYVMGIFQIFLKYP